MSSKEHLLVLGATSATGLVFTRRALDQGYRLTLLVRSPEKLPAAIKDSPSANILKGSFDKEADLAAAASGGATTLVSFAGPLPKQKGTVITDTYRTLFPHLATNNFARAVVTSSPNFKYALKDRYGLLWSIVILLFRLLAPTIYADVNSAGAFVSDQITQSHGRMAAAVPWTIVRVPFLGDGPGRPIRARYVGDKGLKMRLRRESMVAWMLEELRAAKHVNDAPVLSDG